MGNCCNSHQVNPCAKDPVRGHSFEWRGPWKEGSYYYNDDYVTDFVSYKNVILACKRNHLSDANVEPVLVYDGENPVDVDSQYWSFVLCSVCANDWNDLKFHIDGDTLSYSTDGGETWIEIGVVSIPVIDNLTSTATDQALSANQGRILDGKISGVSNRVSAIESDYIDSEKLNNAIAGITESDPLFSASSAASISASDIQNWNSKTSNVGTVTGVKLNNTTKNPDGNGVVDLGTIVTSEADPVFAASAASGITSADISNWNAKVSNVQSDWNANSGLAQILNKPTIPTKVSDLENDAGYTNNVGTVTAVKVNGSTYNPTSGIVDLGTISGGGGAGTLNTDNSTAQTVSASESLSGNVALHKVSKTGSYNDLLNKPTIPAAVTESTVSGWGFTKNTGTVTSVSVNGNNYTPTNGLVDLGTIGGGGSNMNYQKVTSTEYETLYNADQLRDDVLYVIVDTPVAT